MKSDFELALEFTLKWEGGFVHHPKDPGGPTNRGITQKTYDEFRLRKKLQPQSVAKMTKEECREIYQTWYWGFVDRVTRPEWREFRIVFFDTCVNFGQYGAIHLWQKTLGIRTDGIWGPITFETTKSRINTQGKLRSAIALVCERIRYRGRRVNQDFSQRVFLAGWLNRDTDLIDYVLKLESNPG